MAAPQNKTIQDLAGKWTMNRTLSDDVDGVLKIDQGFSTLSRKAIAHAPVHLHVSHPSAQEIKIDQTTTANIPAVNEDWITDWQERETKDPVMGKIRHRSRWVETVEGEDQGWLMEGWLEGSEDVGKQGKRVEAEVQSVDKGWTAHQTWGFATMNGSRHFVRRVIVRSQGGGVVQRVKLVYDFDS